MDRSKLKLGIIGLSKGNGHPFSWSAIINGDYHRKAMSKCGFAGIPVYLAANFDTLGIDDAEVTHVWTQDRNLSEHIAKAARIENVVDQMEDMIGQVDAVLLARDDPENHVSMAKPFLEAGIPLFIDKPLAISKENLAYFVQQHKMGKLFMSCSSMRYSGECRTAKTEFVSTGEIELVTAVGKKDWVKYGVHMLEALFAVLDDPKAISVQNIGKAGEDIVLIRFENGQKATVHLFMDIAATFQLSLFGRNKWKLVEIQNSYAMFKENLHEFIRSVREGRARLPFEKTENIIQTLIGAKESLEQGGVIVDLTS